MCSAGFWGWFIAVGTLVSSIPLWFSWEFSPEPQAVGGSCWLLLVLIFTSQSQGISVLSYFYFPSGSLLTPGAFPLWWAVCSSGGLQKADQGSEAMPWSEGQSGWCPRALPEMGTAEPSCPPSTALGSSGHATNWGCSWNRELTCMRLENSTSRGFLSLSAL